MESEAKIAVLASQHYGISSTTGVIVTAAAATAGSPYVTV